MQTVITNRFISLLRSGFHNIIFDHYTMSPVLLIFILFPHTVIDLVTTKEYFEHRHDKLYERQHNQRSGLITEFFQEGRHKHLKGA